MYDELVKRLREPCQYENCILCQQAADAIEERCQQVDKFAEEAARLYAKLPRWISVTEALPSVEKEVYVTDGEYIARANLLDEVFPGDKPCWSYSGLGEITHWCMQIPLPEPPKEEA
jgi:hypothetical protein